nr:MAG TPA: hypothetical protein [Bacteriophage sp.]
MLIFLVSTSIDTSKIFYSYSYISSVLKKRTQKIIVTLSFVCALFRACILFSAYIKIIHYVNNVN